MRIKVINFGHHEKHFNQLVADITNEHQTQKTPEQIKELILTIGVSTYVKTFCDLAARYKENYISIRFTDLYFTEEDYLSSEKEALLSMRAPLETELGSLNDSFANFKVNLNDFYQKFGKYAYQMDHCVNQAIDRVLRKAYDKKKYTTLPIPEEILNKAHEIAFEDSAAEADKITLKLIKKGRSDIKDLPQAKLLFDKEVFEQLTAAEKEAASSILVGPSAINPANFKKESSYRCARLKELATPQQREM